MLLGAGVSSGFLPLKPHSLTPPGVRKPPFPEVQGSWATWAGQEPRVELCLTAGSEDGVMRRCPRELPPLLFSSEFPGFSHSLGYPAAAGWPPPCSLGKGGEMETLCRADAVSAFLILGAPTQGAAPSLPLLLGTGGTLSPGRQRAGQLPPRAASPKAAEEEGLRHHRADPV